MGLKCTKHFRIVVKPPADMPLDQAIYVASANAIYGVRGGFIHKYTSAGSFVSKRRWCPHSGGNSTIVYEPVNNELWVACWHDPYWSGLDTAALHNYNIERRIYRLNVSTLAQIGTVELTWPVGPQYQWPQFWQGIKELAYSNASGSPCIYAYLAVDASSEYLLKINPATYPVGWTHHDLGISYNGCICTNIVEYGGDIWIGQPYESPASSNLLQCNATTCVDFGSLTIPSGFPPLGFCYASGSFWCGLRASQFIRRVPVDGSPTTSIDIGVANSVTTRLRYDSTLNLVFVSNSSSDSVSWFNPAASGTVYYKTGFDYPIDIVTTGTKAFAVQGGSVGLLEIDTTAPTGHT